MVLQEWLAQGEFVDSGGQFYCAFSRAESEEDWNMFGELLLPR
jgi:hypothetical protein